VASHGAAREVDRDSVDSCLTTSLSRRAAAAAAAELPPPPNYAVLGNREGIVYFLDHFFSTRNYDCLANFSSLFLSLQVRSSRRRRRRYCNGCSRFLVFSSRPCDTGKQTGAGEPIRRRAPELQASSPVTHLTDGLLTPWVKAILRWALFPLLFRRAREGLNWEASREQVGRRKGVENRAFQTEISLARERVSQGYSFPLFASREGIQEQEPLLRLRRRVPEVAPAAVLYTPSTV